MWINIVQRSVSESLNTNSNFMMSTANVRGDGPPLSTASVIKDGTPDSAKNFVRITLSFLP
jgi:hypothetical protein